MKSISLFWTCLLAATVASATNQWTESASKTSKKQSSVSRQDGTSYQPESVIDTMNESNYDRTFGVRTKNFTNSQKSEPIDSMNESRYDRTFGVRTKNYTNSQQAESVNAMDDSQVDRTYGVRESSAVSEGSEYGTSNQAGTGYTKDSTAGKRTGTEHSDIDEDRPIYGGAAVGTGTETTQAPQTSKSTTSTTSGTSTTSTEESGTTAATGAAGAKTAEGQSQSSKDLEITRQIRQEIMNNKDLSIRAENITIVTENGRVSIRGSVPNANEKSAVEKIARGVTGVMSVNNEVTVKK